MRFSLTTASYVALSVALGAGVARPALAVGAIPWESSMKSDSSAMQSQSAGAISGRVVDAVTSEPVSGAMVRIQAASGTGGPISVVSDRDGRFVATGISAGQYQVSARQDGYLEGRAGQSRPGMPSRLVNAGSSASPTDLTIMLWRAGVITGTVRNADGRPLTGVSVAAMTEVVDFGSVRLASAGRPAETDDQGRFRVFGLGPGVYVVAATPPMRQRPELAGRESELSELDVPGYAPHAVKLADANRHSLAAGSEIIVDVTLQRLRAAAVSGSLSGSVPFEGGEVLEFRMVGTRSVRGTSVRPDRSFDLSGLVPGRYTVSLLGARHNPGRPSVERERPVVFAVQVFQPGTKHEIILEPLATLPIQGRVLHRTGRALTTAERASFRLAIVPRDRDATTAIPVTLDLDPDSRFSADIWPGDYLVRLSSRQDGWVVTSANLRGVDVLPGLNIEGQSTAGALEIGVTDKGGSVLGSISNAQTGAGNCAAVVFAVDPKRWQSPGGTQVVKVDDEGRFRSSALPPGDYMVSAVVTERIPNDPTLLHQLMAHATRLHVPEGGRIIANLTCRRVGTTN